MFEGRHLHRYWAMLFSDLLLFTVTNRDRVIYVVEEPVPIRAIVHAVFTLKKKGDYALTCVRNLIIIISHVLRNDPTF